MPKITLVHSLHLSINVNKMFQLLEPFGGANVPLKMLVDNKQLFDSVADSPRTKERRLMIDLFCGQGSLQKGA